MKNTNQVKISTICFYKINHHALLDENVVALNELTVSPVVSPPSPPARPEYANLEVSEETEEFEVRFHIIYKMLYCVPHSPSVFNCTIVFNSSERGTILWTYLD